MSNWTKVHLKNMTKERGKLTYGKNLLLYTSEVYWAHAQECGQTAGSRP